MLERSAAVWLSLVRNTTMVSAAAVRLPWPRPSNAVENQIISIGAKILRAKPVPAKSAAAEFNRRWSLSLMARIGARRPEYLQDDRYGDNQPCCGAVNSPFS